MPLPLILGLCNYILDKLIAICQAYHDKVNALEEEKYDMEKEVEFKDYKVNLLNPYHQKASFSNFMKMEKLVQIPFLNSENKHFFELSRN